MPYPDGSWAARRVAWALLVAEALAVVTLGSVTALRFMMPRLSPIDEGAHIAYVQVVTEQHRLPVLDRDLTTPEVLSLASGTYPRIVGPSRTGGLVAYSYEAFQPPLYYVLAAPVFALAPGDFVHGVYALRFFGVALLLLAFALFGVLCRDIVGERWPLAAALGWVFFVLPGVVARAATVGNVALEVPLGVLTVLLAWRSVQRASLRWLAGAVVALAAGLLTKTLMVMFVPAVATAGVLVVLRRRSIRAAVTAAALGVVPVLLVLPWLLWNLHTYGAFTATDIALRMQQGIINPTHHRYTLTEAVETLPAMAQFAMPQEGGPASHPLLVAAGWITTVVLIVLPPFVLKLHPADRVPLVGVLATPYLSGLAVVAGLTLLADWPSFMPRYVHAAVPSWVLLGSLAYLGIPPPGRVTRRVTALLLLATAVLWYACLRSGPWRG